MAGLLAVDAWYLLAGTAPARLDTVGTFHLPGAEAAPA
jgi:hypothetical protein